jgi:hypothetical protein
MMTVIAYGLSAIEKLGGLDAAKAVAAELLHLVHNRKSPEETHAAIMELEAKFEADIASGNAARDKELHDKFDTGPKK